jgi:hypothetical protein
MGIAAWIGLYVIVTGVCVWFVLDDGEVVAALFGPGTAEWSETGIRVFVGGVWLLLTVWFVLGLFEPSLRL